MKLNYSLEEYLDKLKDNKAINERDATILYESLLSDNFPIVFTIVDKLLDRFNRRSLNNILFKPHNEYIKKYRSKVSASFAQDVLDSNIDDFITIITFFNNEDNGNYFFSDLLKLNTNDTIMLNKSNELATSFVSSFVGSKDGEVKAYFDSFVKRYSNFDYNKFDMMTCTSLIEIAYVYKMMFLIKDELKNRQVVSIYNKAIHNIRFILKYIETTLVNFNFDYINSGKLSIRQLSNYEEYGYKAFIERLELLPNNSPLRNIFIGLTS